jgi:hypothetical protein
VYFYELHEGDDDLMSDVILACEVEVPRDEFLALVEEARATVAETFEEDSLIEAIAAELERTHGFVFVSDARLVGSVRIAADPTDDRLVGADTDHRRAELTREDDALDEDAGLDEDAELPEQPDYLTILADFDPDAPPN